MWFCTISSTYNTRPGTESDRKGMWERFWKGPHSCRSPEGPVIFSTANTVKNYWEPKTTLNLNKTYDEGFLLFLSIEMMLLKQTSSSATIAASFIESCHDSSGNIILLLSASEQLCSDRIWIYEQSFFFVLLKHKKAEMSIKLTKGTKKYQIKCQ